jgi:hypothetical protein
MLAKRQLTNAVTAVHWRERAMISTGLPCFRLCRGSENRVGYLPGTGNQTAAHSA